MADKRYFNKEYWKTEAEKARKLLEECYETNVHEKERGRELLDEYDKRARRFKRAMRVLIVLSLILFAISVGLFGQLQKAEGELEMAMAIADYHRQDAERWIHNYTEAIKKSDEETAKGGVGITSLEELRREIEEEIWRKTRERLFIEELEPTM